MYVILGGGISGMSAAHYLLKTVRNVNIFEGSNRVGGWIRSTRTSKGFVFEHGPRTVRPKGPSGENTLALVEELDLSDKVIPIKSDHPAAQNRLIYVNKRLHKLPSSLKSLFVTSPPFSKPLITALLQDLKAPKKQLNDESIYSFVERRLGKELADFAISPLICGICAGDAKEISVRFLMNSLFEAEQTYGSIIKGMLRNSFGVKSKSASRKCDLFKKAQSEKWSVWSLDGGLELLTETLKHSIEHQDAEIRLNSYCRGITFLPSGKVMVDTENKSMECERVISALPASQLSLLLEKQHPELSKELAAVPAVSVAVVNLQFKGRLLESEAFGFLVPPSENIPILGVVYDSCCFPKGDNTVLTVMMGGRWFNSLFGNNPHSDEIFNVALNQVQTILGIKDAPEDYLVSILHDCIPQYVLGHHERVNRIRDYLKKNCLPLSVIGASYDGVGVNDVILSAKVAVNEFISLAISKKKHIMNNYLIVNTTRGVAKKKATRALPSQIAYAVHYSGYTISML